MKPRIDFLVPAILMAAPAFDGTDPPKVRDWALPGSATHQQVATLLRRTHGWHAGLPIESVTF
jgi:hypothetical protein